MNTESVTATAPKDYLLQLADNSLVLGQRNAEWCGHGPVLEEDIAMANIALDLIGQARLLYQYAADVINAESGSSPAMTEDRLAYFRDVADFRNYTLLELPHHGPLAATATGNRDYATTIVRQYLYSVLMCLVWESLQEGADKRLAAIAAKSLKEVRYHVRHATDWMLRLGDGTEQSHQRMQAALDHLMPYTQEFWTSGPAELQALSDGCAPDMATLCARWDEEVDTTLDKATLRRPSHPSHVSRGKIGIHSEHLGYLLANMQSVARAHPHAIW